MTARLRNRDVNRYVNARTEFTTINKTLYGEWRRNAYGSQYVVYSYGPHFPMYVFDDSTFKWFGNEDKYSSTTSRHQGYARPSRIDAWVDTDTIKRIAVYGVVGAVEQRLAA